MIDTVHLWSNGMVMVFDAAGQQLPDYQGPLLKVRAAILRDAGPRVRFFIGQFGAAGGTEMAMNRECLASPAWKG